MSDTAEGGFCGCILWGVVVYLLSAFVFPGWSLLFWVLVWFFPPALIVPILLAVL